MSQRESLIKQPALHRGWLFCICWMLLTFTPATLAESTESQRLQEVRSEIKRKQTNLTQQKAALKRINRQLKRDEKKIAKAAKAVHQRRLQLTATESKQTQLKGRQQQLQVKQRKQQQMLASQLRSAYLAGQHDYIKLLLNQQNSGRLERTLNYYQYLNRARVESIDEMLATGKELQQIATDLTELAAQQHQQLEQQKREQQTLADTQQKRKQTRKKLEKLLDSEAIRLTQLRQSENQLLQLTLTQKSPEPELTGLKGLRGRVERPLVGKVRHRYGSRRQGSIRWKGIYIDAQAGKAIHAIHQGKVLYADWLKGMGLVLILDHGEGYMSLYAHAQALLKQAGESVKRGETIALVGQSGGQSRAGLYFEMRHRGEPVNPSRWFKL